MRTLTDVRPSPEQLAIVSRNKPGIEIIRGAAGSGKTTTALLRLRSLTGLFVSRRRRQRSDEPVHVLVLTFNRTLRGYIETLAKQQFSESDDIKLEISTFAKWSMKKFEGLTILQDTERKNTLYSLVATVSPEIDFILDEVEYAMGRFLPDEIENYMNARRYGRGTTPRVDKVLRRAIIDDVIKPYQQWKQRLGKQDWNDLAIMLAADKKTPLYDIIITDETQDFSANQVRAITNQLAITHSLTMIVDTAQRIYARGFTWQEAGLVVRPENSLRLERNYRNTIEIAQFAAPLIQGIPLDDDATIPDFSKCGRKGAMPIILRGRYRSQVAFVINYIKNEVDLVNESVAVLHPYGGGWFSFIAATGLFMDSPNILCLGGSET